MTANEFIANNHDILLHRVAPHELGTLTEGTPLFLIVTHGGRDPLDQQLVKAAHHAVCAGNPYPGAVHVVTAARTPRRHLVIPENVDGSDATNILFLTAPLRHDDPRRNQPWTAWGTNQK